MTHAGSAACRLLQALAMTLSIVPALPAQQGPTAGAVPSGWRFTENRGQWPEPLLFAGSGGGATVRLERDRMLLRLANVATGEVIRGVVLRLTWSPGSVAETVKTAEEFPGPSHYFLGSDPDGWRSNVPAYGRVTYEGVAPGIDLVWRDEHGRLEFDVLAAPGVDVGQLMFRWEGMDQIQQLADQSLVLRTALGDVRQTAPLAWEEDVAGSRTPVACGYRVLDGGCFAFQVSRRNHLARLVIDPSLEWSTLLGGSQSDQVRAVAQGDDGTITVGGQTLSVDFPTTPGAFDTTYTPGSGNWDAFVSRVDATGGVLEFSTYVGGAEPEWLTEIALSTNSEVVICGTAFGPSFPTTPGAFDTAFAGWEAYVARLSSDGSRLIYSTFLGGASVETGEGMTVNSDGVVTLCGQTLSLDFPVTPGAFDTTNEGAPMLGDAYVARIGPAGDALLYATFLGGSASEGAKDVGVMNDGTVVLAGRAGLSGIPWTTNLGAGGLFVVRFDPTLSQLLSATSLGGTGDDRVHALALDSLGAAYLTGWTMAPDFPTTPGAFDPNYSGNLDAYVLKLDPTGSALTYSTYLGGGAADLCTAIAVDSAGVATVTGVTGSSTFPTTPGSAFPGIQPGGDAFVTRLNPNGTGLWYSTLLGGSGQEGSAGDERSGLDLGPEGEAVVGGYTTSTDFPTTTGALDETANGMQDGFVTKLDMLPTGANKVGSSTPGCAGPLAIGVTSMPQVGKPFGLTCTNAPAGSAQGILLLGLAPLAQSVAAKGADLWVNPSPLLLLLPATSNAQGLCWLQGAIPISPGLAGATVAVQFFWPNVCGPPGLLCASNALAITIQP